MVRATECEHEFAALARFANRQRREQQSRDPALGRRSSSSTQIGTEIEPHNIVDKRARLIFVKRNCSTPISVNSRRLRAVAGRVAGQSVK